MASIIPEVLNHFNIYNGANALVGVSGEVELPELEAITDTVEGTGVLGEIEDPVTGQFSSATIKIPIRSFIQRYVLHRKHYRAAAPDTQRIYAVHGSKDRSNRILPDQSRGTRQSQDNHTRQGSQRKEDGIRGRA